LRTGKKKRNSPSGHLAKELDLSSFRPQKTEAKIAAESSSAHHFPSAVDCLFGDAKKAKEEIQKKMTNKRTRVLVNFITAFGLLYTCSGGAQVVGGIYFVFIMPSFETWSNIWAGLWVSHIFPSYLG
jgi:hypothetical protein